MNYSEPSKTPPKHLTLSLRTPFITCRSPPLAQRRRLGLISPRTAIPRRAHPEPLLGQEVRNPAAKKPSACAFFFLAPKHDRACVILPSSGLLLSPSLRSSSLSSWRFFAKVGNEPNTRSDGRKPDSKAIKSVRLTPPNGPQPTREDDERFLLCKTNAMFWCEVADRLSGWE